MEKWCFECKNAVFDDNAFSGKCIALVKEFNSFSGKQIEKAKRKGKFYGEIDINVTSKCSNGRYVMNHTLIPEEVKLREVKRKYGD